jgi:UDP-N-acetylmuramoyl-tripeptide--D-alanyl-D-alanine ligase
VIKLTLSELAAELGCELPDRNPLIEKVVTDSRKVRHGALFAALPGSRVDGHDFAESACRLGAAALLVSRRLDLDVPQLVVDDVLQALGRIAALVRSRVDPVVIGITGSNGKTTVKEMIASILRQDSKVLSTRGNFNNELGLPLTLLRLKNKHRYAVLEMGASRAGDIRYLAELARPDLGLITNVGPAHLKGFGSLEGVARAKGEMYESLPSEGWAIVNEDEPWAEQWKARATARNIMTFGESDSAMVRLAGTEQAAVIVTPAGRIDLDLRLPGRHNQINAAAAAAVGLALGLELDAIRRGLSAVKPVPGRLNLVETDFGWTVIDDTYNANPASLYSALQVLAGMQGNSWLILGDMKELGDDSRKLHAEVGEAARAMGVRRLFATGEHAEATVEAFGENGAFFETREDLIEAVLGELRPGVNCLVKGSRSMGMEAVVEAIENHRAMQEAS